MNEKQTLAALEALLYVAGDEGLSIEQLVAALEISKEQIKYYVEKLRETLQQEERGLQLVELANRYQLVTKGELSIYLQRLAEAPTQQQLSQAALETLAIIAYKQPVTRSQIEEVRGVKTERPLATLQARGLIKEKGRAEGIGRPILYGTTREFLDYFGLKDLKELPIIEETLSEHELIEETDLFFKAVQSPQ